MKDIVEASEMSRGGVYMYFSSTEEIFRAMLEKNDETSISDLMMLYDSATNGRESIERLVAGIAGPDNDNATGDSLFSAVCEYFFDTRERRPETSLFLQTRYKRIIDAFVAFLQDGVNKGYFSPSLPLETIARSVLTWNDGLWMHRIGFGNDTVDAGGQLETMKQVLYTLLNVDAMRATLR